MTDSVGTPRRGSPPVIAEVRSTLKASRDPRALRTRAALIAATSTLMHKSGEAFTAEQIATEAGVSRSSFYAHFTSAEAAVLAVFRDTIDTIGRDGFSSVHLTSSDGLNFARAATTAVVTHVAENQPLYRAVLQLDLQADAYSAVFADFTAVVHAAVLSLESVPSHIQPSTAAAYIAGGSLAVLRERIISPDAIDVDPLVEELVGMIPDWFTNSTLSTTTRRVSHSAETE
jgi:AcrR family transcriptional regulator